MPTPVSRSAVHILGFAARRCLAGVAALLVLLALTPASADPRPNFVIVMADDLDVPLLRSMPATLELVAAKGLTFERAYTGVPLCGPARAQVLTARYAHNTGMRHHFRGNGGFYDFRVAGLEEQTFGTWMKAAGYRTALVGKYINEYPGGYPGSSYPDGFGVEPTYVPPGWTTWVAAMETSTFPSPYNLFDYYLNENGTVVHYGTTAADYGTDVLRDRSLAFINASVAAGDPFLLYFAPMSPHVPNTSAPRHAGMFAGALAPRPASFNEADVSDKPTFIRNLTLTTRVIGFIETEYRKRLQALRSVDEAIRAIHDRLQALGQLDSTYIVVTSDNGYHLGHHRLWHGKWLAYEEDIRLPLVWRGPGIPAGKIDKVHMIADVDLAPTIAELAGVTVPNAIDGRSVAPILRNPWIGASLPSRQSTYLARYAPPPPMKQDFTTLRGVRTKRYTWVEWANGERELYDNFTDPLQLRNLAASATTATLRSRLSTLTSRLATCSGAACRTIENETF